MCGVSFIAEAIAHIAALEAATAPAGPLRPAAAPP